MREVGFELSGALTTKLTSALAAGASIVVTMGAVISVPSRPE
jgi:hypothetical protein